ncbi:MAG: hypothetical protein HC945_02125 [Nitrosarchaeum sp.]|nr:hypothetical protein [Nitrosarchaeum sp.]
MAIASLCETRDNKPYVHYRMMGEDRKVYACLCSDLEGFVESPDNGLSWRGELSGLLVPVQSVSLESRSSAGYVRGNVRVLYRGTQMDMDRLRSSFDVYFNMARPSRAITKKFCEFVSCRRG